MRPRRPDLRSLRPVNQLRTTIRLLNAARSSPSQAVFGVAMGVVVTGGFVLLTTPLPPTTTAIVAGFTAAGIFASLYSLFAVVSGERQVTTELLNLESEVETLIEEVGEELDQQLPEVKLP